MKNWLIFIFGVFLAIGLCSCEKLDKPELDSDNSINGLKCCVYYDLDNWGRKSELDALSGIYYADRGIISYTFPDDSEMYNSFTLTRCRLEVSIPSTAKVVEIDAFGNQIADGLGGQRTLYNETVYFNVIAANGDTKTYQATFRANN